MEQLQRWLEAQFAERKTESNSGLGKAITYLLRQWRPLTLFLRQAGAPLDNNIAYAASGMTMECRVPDYATSGRK
jgi:transposase